MAKRRAEYPIVFTQSQLAATPAVRPVFLWLFGGAVAAFLLLRRKDVAAVTEQAVEKAIESGKAVIGTLRDVKDQVLLVRGLYAAVDAELPNLPTKSKVIIVAQALHESGWNKGRAALNANNWWNITAGPAWKGPTFLAIDGDRSYETSDCTRLKRPMTFKDEKGRSYCKIDQLWRKYATLNEAVRDYWDFLGPNQNRGRYLVARTALEAGDATAFVRELKKAGYYTADQTEYTTAINNLVSSVNRRL
jgi:hypothetical protein